MMNTKEYKSKFNFPTTTSTLQDLTGVRSRLHCIRKSTSRSFGRTMQKGRQATQMGRITRKTCVWEPIHRVTKQQQ